MDKDGVVLWDAAEEPTQVGRRRALIVLCLGVLMVTLDTTIVNVALRAIQDDLGLSRQSLAWIVNAYALTFGGFLLLGGRLGDIFSYRRIFVLGIVLFTVASLVCGLARSQPVLVAARAFQGFGGAIVVAIALSLITRLFTNYAERAKAMSVYGFVSAGGGSVGLLLGGLLTSALDWRWVFLINLPIGSAVCFAALRLLPDNLRVPSGDRVDIWGAVTVTASSVLAVYALANGGGSDPWAKTVGLLTCAAGLLAIFCVIEQRVSRPLIPPRLLRCSSLTIANILGCLWAASASAWLFSSALYMQEALGCRPLQVALAFLPTNGVMAVFSLGVSSRVVKRFGIRAPLTAGLLLVTAGLLSLSEVPVDGQVLRDIVPGMTLVGLGAGIAVTPLLVAAVSDVELDEASIASGIFNTALMLGGALGLAILVRLSTAETGVLLSSGAPVPIALRGGYRLVCQLGAGCAGIAALVGAVFLPTRPE